MNAALTLKQQQNIKKDDLFVEYLLKIIKDNKKARSTFRSSIIQNQEYKAWEYLSSFNIDITKKYQRIPAIFIGYAISLNDDIEKNGSANFGKALRSCYLDGSNSDPAKSKLKRILSATSTEEVCLIMRPLLNFFYNKDVKNIDYKQLMSDIKSFNFEDSAQRTKLRWTKSFFDYEGSNDE
jgi:CRISPR system Cascade subunit CasB